MFIGVYFVAKYKILLLVCIPGKMYRDKNHPKVTETG